MYVTVVLHEGVSPRAAVITQVAGELLHLFVDSLDMALEIPLLGALKVAEITTKVLYLAVD